MLGWVNFQGEDYFLHTRLEYLKEKSGYNMVNESYYNM